MDSDHQQEGTEDEHATSWQGIPRFDVGCTPTGSDDKVRQPFEDFKIGCSQLERNRRPMFIYMESGTHVEYAKIQTLSSAW
jgi:hypothetical protein